MTNYYNLLVGDSEQLDLYDVSDFQIDLSFFLVNPERLDQRGGVASNTFKIPATKNNNRLFQHFGTTGAYDAAVQNFNKLKNVSVVVGGLKVADGFLRGKSYGFSDKPNYYEVMFLGGNKDWSDLLAETKLIDLPFPSIEWRKGSVELSWYNTWSSCATAPMVNYGMFKNGINHFDDNDLLSPVKVKMKYNDFRYWHYAKWIVVEMFKKIGWKIDGTFINDAEFERFITYHNDLNIYEEKTENDFIYLGTDLISEERMCLDYFKGITEFFNLYFIPDFNTKTITIETYTNFLKVNDKLNWTNKIDLSKDNKLIPYNETPTSYEYKLKPDCLADLMQTRYPESFIGDPSQPISYGSFWKYPYHDFPDGLPYFYTLNSKPLITGSEDNNYFKVRLEAERAEAIKTYENSYFTGTFMAHFATAIPYSELLSVFKPIIHNHFEEARTIAMLCVVDSVEDEMLFGILQAGRCGFGSYKQIGNKLHQGTEPRIAYYAGMKKIQPLMRIGLHFGLSDGLEATDSTEHNDCAKSWEWYDDVMNERPYAYLCDYTHEDGGKNFLLPNQTVNITGFDSDILNLHNYYFQEQLKMEGMFSKRFTDSLSMFSQNRRLEAYFKLKSVDIANLDFQKLITIEHRDFMLYEVNKWTAISDNSTLCKLFEYTKAAIDFKNNYSFPNHIMLADGQNYYY